MAQLAKIATLEGMKNTETPLTGSNVTQLNPKTKHCWKCETAKLLADFSADKSRADGLQPICRPCAKATREARKVTHPGEIRRSYNKWYANPENAKKHNQATVKRNREYADFMVAKFKDGPCTDCKQKFIPAAMEFDHKPGTEKKFQLNVHGLRSHSLESVLAEIAKCDLVCANCHRVRTMSRNQVGRKG